MIVVDASAVLAIYLNEPERDRFTVTLETAGAKVIFAGQLLGGHRQGGPWTGNAAPMKFRC